MTEIQGVRVSEGSSYLESTVVFTAEKIRMQKVMKFRRYCSNAVQVRHFVPLTSLIIYMKKLLDSDWLKAVQFRCNTSAKSVTPVQIKNRRGRKQRPGFSLGKQQ